MFALLMSVLFSLAYAPILPGSPPTLREARAQGLIQVDVAGTGGHTGESQRLEVRSRQRRAAGAPAFSNPPLAVRGVFVYQTSANIQASFGLYNEAGELVHAFFTDQLQRKGGHRFTFSFDIRNLPSGTYFARLSSRENVLEDLRVEW